MRLVPRWKKLLLAATLALLCLQPLVGGAAPAAPSPQAPRLVVVLVIDQFRADYVERFRDRFGLDGFNRLLRQGATFTSCNYPYANTETGPGHATLATGTTPDRHGIASNTWYDPAEGKIVQAIEDKASPLVGSAGKISGVSPRALVGTTLADELRLATHKQAKVFGVALKDRAAVLSTGHAASGAYWYNAQTGTFVTSRYYREELPAWVVAFNQKRAAASYYGKAWKTGEKVFNPMTTESGQPDERYFGGFPYTPYGNDLVLDFARELIGQEGLGADGVTDFLFVGFSSNDYIGHRWGPYSEEVADATVRTDAQIAELLKFLDQRVGPGRYWLVVSGDHGVAPTLKQARDLGLNAKNVDPEAAIKAVKEALAAKWGDDKWLEPGDEIVFNRETLNRRGVAVAEAAHLAGSVLAGIDGIAGYLAGTETNLSPALAKAVRLNLYPGRSPDVYALIEPFAVIRGDRGGTTHGTPYSYDTHVPLLFYGPAFRPGTYPKPVAPIDLAPTLAAALGINPPALATGTVLNEALAVAPPPPPPARGLQKKK